MKKLLFIALATGMVASSHAMVNFELDNPFQTVTAPESGSISLLFTGSVTFQSSGWTITSLVVEHPALASYSDPLSINIRPEFSAAYGGVNYSGPIFEVVVTSTSLGDYFYNNTFGSIFSEAFLYATDGVNTITDSEFFGVKVEAVPEPATFAVLGLGAAALVRKRRK